MTGDDQLPSRQRLCYLTVASLVKSLLPDANDLVISKAIPRQTWGC